MLNATPSSDSGCFKVVAQPLSEARPAIRARTQPGRGRRVNPHELGACTIRSLLGPHHPPRIVEFAVFRKSGRMYASGLRLTNCRSGRRFSAPNERSVDLHGLAYANGDAAGAGAGIGADHADVSMRRRWDLPIPEIQRATGRSR